MLNIFVVDDDKIIRKGLISIIESDSSKYKVIGEAPNGLRALEKLKEVKPDILITDIKMPVMDGMELIKNITELGMDIKFIVLSGFDDYKYVRETMKKGAADYLLKPIDNDALFSILDKIEKEIELEKEEKAKFNDYNEKLSESKLILNEKVLLRLIDNIGSEVNYLSQDIKDLGIGTGRYFSIAILSIDDCYKEKCKGGFDIGKLKNQIHEFNRISYSNIEIIVGEQQWELILLFSSSEQDKKVLFDFTEAYLKNIKSEIDQNNSFTLSIGISEIFSELKYAFSACNQARTALDWRFYKGKNSIFKYEMSSNGYCELEQNNLESYMNELVNSIEINNSVKLRAAIESLMDLLYKKGVEPDKFRRILINIVSKLSTVSADFQYALEDIENNDESIVFYIEKINTFSDLRRYIINTFAIITDKIKVMRKERSEKIIEKAKLYIQSYYKEDISLKAVADQVYLNPNYFSELFKNEVGVNFIDYLIETRVNAAKELLKKPGIKIYEIGQLVGYGEPVSFNRAFKKVVGVSPKEYIKLLK